MSIRTATLAELPSLIAIQARAGLLFADIGMQAVAAGQLPTVADLTEPTDDGRILVAAGEDDGPIGYVHLAWVDGLGHVDQVSVDPAHGRRGVGRELMDAAEEWGRARGLTTMTLTTFLEVPWNGPFYRRLGWREIPPDELGPELAAVRAVEIGLGLDAWPRAAMAKSVGASTT